MNGGRQWSGAQWYQPMREHDPRVAATGARKIAPILQMVDQTLTLSAPAPRGTSGLS